MIQSCYMSLQKVKNYYNRDCWFPLRIQNAKAGKNVHILTTRKSWIKQKIITFLNPTETKVARQPMSLKSMERPCCEQGWVWAQACLGPGRGEDGAPNQVSLLSICDKSTKGIKLSHTQNRDCSKRYFQRINVQGLTEFICHNFLHVII